ncbi:flagellar motor switch protein FliN [Solicola sp. PLA-1-18]|uniref:flagellar motor switch protein FliN n=1 Tax=Solicola sp. PLA-1-18 TaxID=3380532 RepID=UPI003B81E23E
MTTFAPPTSPQAALDAASAAAGVLPSAVELAVGTPQPLALLAAGGFTAAAVATLDGSEQTVVAVLVQSALVDALASSPIGELDLASAVQPALDAAAAAVGSTAGPARRVSPDEVASLAGPGALGVPLVDGASTHAAVVVSLPPVTAAPAPVTSTGPGIAMLHGVEMQVTVEIGRTRMTVRELLDLAPGDVLELDRAAGSPADMLVNGRLVARGEIVVVDESFALRVTEILPPAAS